MFRIPTLFCVLTASAFSQPASYSTYGSACAGTGLGSCNVIPLALNGAFGGWHPQTLLTTPFRFQQVFRAELPLALRMSGVALRRPAWAFGMSGGPIDLEIRLGYTTFGSTNITSNFDANFNSGTPVTVVPRRTFMLPNMPPALPTDPRVFEIELPFTVPFDWQFQTGRSLLIEFKVRTQTPFYYPLDGGYRMVGNYGMTSSTVSAAPETAATGLVGVQYGLAMCFRSAAQPQLGNVGRPVLGQTFSITLGSARPNTLALLLLGTSTWSWAGLPLPLALAPLGAPGCSVLASADLTLPLAVDGSGRGSYPLSIANVPASIGTVFFNQFAVLDQPANPMGLVWSQGGRGQIGQY